MVQLGIIFQVCWVLGEKATVLSVAQAQGQFPCLQARPSVSHTAGGMLFRALGSTAMHADSSVLLTYLGESCLTETTAGSEDSEGCGLSLS